MLRDSYFNPFYDHRQRARETHRPFTERTSHESAKAFHDNSVLNNQACLINFNSESELPRSEHGPSRLGTERLTNPERLLRGPLLASKFNQDTQLTSPQSCNQRRPTVEEGISINLGAASLSTPQIGREVSTTVIRSTPHKRGSRQQHLAVLTAIFHRCLLEADFPRAGRALGMMLRTEQKGHSIDPRFGHKWGLAAEILLRRKEIHHQKGKNSSRTASRDEHRGENVMHIVKSDDLQMLHEYYGRLQLQYPYSKAYPDAVGPIEFLVALYSIRIKNALDLSILAAEANDVAKRGAASTLATTYRELGQEADAIYEGLQDFITYPPFSGRGSYVSIQGTVNDWLSDLHQKDP